MSMKMHAKVTHFPMRDILVRIKVLDKDQSYSLITKMVIKIQIWMRLGKEKA
jgi:hypothetical protein